VTAKTARDIIVVVLVLAGAFVSLGIFMIASATLITFVGGRYADKVLFTSMSPDGRYRLVGAERADFPANEILDPSATLTIRLTDASTGELLDQFSFESHEYWDFNEEPSVNWERDGRVRVRDIDTRGHHVSAILDVRALQ
jgi:hypothetical protein